MSEDLVVAGTVVPGAIVPLWQNLSGHVSRICEGRDPSHGHDHMQKVAGNALTILAGETIASEQRDRVYRQVTIAAWLHDVADHKYDRDGSLQQQLQHVLEEVCHDLEEARVVQLIIENVSYSKEERWRRQHPDATLDWEALLGDAVTALIRHIVSDADKLEAIGAPGVHRCAEYAAHAYQHQHPGQQIPRDLLCQHVLQHADEKLLRLKDHFIRTTTGRQLATPLHEAMVQELAAFAT
jgi:uncharacterized protein